MDSVVPEGFSSTYNRRSKKCQRDAIQAQLAKEQKLLQKGGSICSRELGKDQERMRKCLERLENDKKKISMDYEMAAASQNSLQVDDKDLETPHSRTGRPVSGYKIREQSRSLRQLKEAGATSSDLKRATTRRHSDAAHSDSVPRVKFKADDGLSREKSNLSRPAPPSTPNPSIILTEDECKDSQILYIPPNTKPDSKCQNHKQLISSEKRESHSPQKDIQHGRRESVKNPAAGHEIHSPRGSKVTHRPLHDEYSSRGSLIGHRSSHNEPFQRSSIFCHRSSHNETSPRGSIIGHRSLHEEHSNKSPSERRTSLHTHCNHRSRVTTQNESIEELQNLYEIAVHSVTSSLTGGHEQGRRSSLPGSKSSFLHVPEHIPNMSMLDPSALEDLQELLKEARLYRDRKNCDHELANHPGHLCPLKTQKRRLEHLEQILERLSRHSATKFNPREMLSCGYLRLSKNNVETLENMLRDMGENAGIHAHSDVTDYDIWAEIKKENEESLGGQSSQHSDRSLPIKKVQ